MLQAKRKKTREVKSIVKEIQTLTHKKDCEIVDLDESYFSTEPYVVRGWQKTVTTEGYLIRC